MKADIYMAASLDGLIADEHGKTDWVKDDDLFEEICHRYGCVAMGHSTFTEYGEPPFKELQYIVFSHKPQPGAGKNVHFVTSVKQAFGVAKKLGCNQLLVIGGGQTNQAFLEAQAVGKVLVDIHSLTLGKGTPMFGDFKGALDFNLVANEWHKEGFMHAEYVLNHARFVTDLVEPAALKKMATPEDYKQGEQIAKHNGVELEGLAPLEVTAQVGELTPNETHHSVLAEAQKVDLRSTAEGLYWRCTCGQSEKLCKHAVAVALAAWQKAPRRA